MGIGFGGDALPVLGQIGEHREQHEAAHEIERLVEAQRLEPGIDRAGIGEPAVAIDRGRADRLGPFIKRVAAIAADHVAQQLA